MVVVGWHLAKFSAPSSLNAFQIIQLHHWLLHWVLTHNCFPSMSLCYLYFKKLGQNNFLWWLQSHLEQVLFFYSKLGSTSNIMFCCHLRSDSSSFLVRILCSSLLKMLYCLTNSNDALIIPSAKTRLKGPLHFVWAHPASCISKQKQ